MAKFGRKLFGLAVLGAAAAGAYYYLKKTENAGANEACTDDDDFDNFERFDEEEVEPKTKRSYVNLDFNTIENKAKEVAVKAADVAEKAASSLADYASKAGSRVEEFFDDRKADNEAGAEEAQSKVNE